MQTCNLMHKFGKATKCGRFASKPTHTHQPGFLFDEKVAPSPRLRILISPRWRKSCELHFLLLTPRLQKQQTPWWIYIDLSFHSWVSGGRVEGKKLTWGIFDVLKRLLQGRRCVNACQRQWWWRLTREVNMTQLPFRWL